MIGRNILTVLGSLWLLYSPLALSLNFICPTLQSFHPVYANNLDLNIAELAEKAYIKARSEGWDSKGIVTIVDFTLPSTAKRLWVIDEIHHRVLLNTYVTHGSGSGGLYASEFSNKPNSLMSSIGVYETLYPYYGKHGKSMKIRGLEYTNSNAERRNIVIHSAYYIGDGKTGRSWGCFAVREQDISKVLELTSGNTMLFAYYPDSRWLHTSKYLH